MEDLERKDARACTSRLVVTLLPKDTNAYGHIFGGVIMSLMDQAAAVAAIRYSGCRVVTASADEITFLTPIYVGEVLTATATILYTGRTSMDIEVLVEVENIPNEPPRLGVKGIFSMVALNQEGKPQPIPPMKLEDPEVRARYEWALARRERKGLVRKDKGKEGSLDPQSL